VRVDYREGQFMLNPHTSQFDFVMVAMEREAKRSVCACCVNKQRSQVKGPKSKKIFLKGQGLKSP